MAEREPDAIDADLDPELNAQLARAYREAESILATQERVIADAVRFAEGLGLDAGDFDDLVHDAKGYEASEINNGGLSDQLDYLASGSDDPEEYLKGLIQAVASDQDTDAQDADSDAP